MIQVRDLTKYYADHIAIEGLTFEVERGEILGFLGPNGAGKSTTMKILTGFIPPSSGTAIVDGQDVVKDSLKARSRIGYLPESNPLYTDMTVRQYLDFMARLRGLDGKKRKTQIDDVMTRCRVDDKADTIIGKLSKGYRQRVGLAQSMVHDPPVLILDEPTVGLDPRQINDTRAVIRNLAGDHTVILSSHILPEISAVCQRVLIINDGRLVAEDTPERLTERLQGSERFIVDVRGPLDTVAQEIARLPNIVGVTPDQRNEGRLIIDSAVGADPRESVATLIVQSGWGLRELRSVGMSLEEIFLKLTTTDAAEAVEEEAVA